LFFLFLLFAYLSPTSVLCFAVENAPQKSPYYFQSLQSACPCPVFHAKTALPINAIKLNFRKIDGNSVSFRYSFSGKITILRDIPQITA